MTASRWPLSKWWRGPHAGRSRRAAARTGLSRLTAWVRRPCPCPWPASNRGPAEGPEPEATVACAGCRQPAVGADRNRPEAAAVARQHSRGAVGERKKRHDATAGEEQRIAVRGHRQPGDRLVERADRRDRLARCAVVDLDRAAPGVTCGDGDPPRVGRCRDQPDRPFGGGSESCLDLLARDVPYQQSAAIAGQSGEQRGPVRRELRRLVDGLRQRDVRPALRS